MKITIVLGAFFPVPPVMGGAVEKIWLLLAEEFARRKHEVTMISRAMDQLPDEETREGVRHIRVEGFDAPGSLFLLKWRDLIYSNRVRRHLPKADILVTNTFWLPLLARRSSHGRIYVHVARYPKGQMRFYGRAARLQAPSTAVGNAIAKQAPALSERVKVIAYPAPAHVRQDEPPLLTTRPRTMLYVGRIHPEKGVDRLLEVFARGASTVFAGWTLVMVGPAEEKFGGGGEAYLSRLKKAAEPARDNIVFTGQVFETARLEERFRSARLFIYPSEADRGESFGLAPLEAMTHGCAVLVSKLGCFRDFVSDGETGFVYDHRAKDPSAALMSALHRAVSDEDLLARVAAAGQRRSADYSLARVAEEFLNDFSFVTVASEDG